MRPTSSSREPEQARPPAWVAALVASAWLGACGGPMTDPDAGTRDAARDGDEAAHVTVDLRFDPETLEDDTILERLSVGIAEVRAPNDRGDLAADVQRSFELADEPAQVMLSSATPAVYGGVEIDASSGSWGSAVVLRLREGERTIELTLTEPLALMGRCDTPLALEPGRTLELHARLDVAGVAHELREAALPEPVGGVIHVDATTSPALVADLAARLRDLDLECDERDDEP